MPATDIAILTTGDELLSGEQADTNSRDLAAALTRYGYRVRCSLAVSDREVEISDALRYLVDHVACVIVTGGLGSTGDDLTARAAARTLGQPLVINDTALTMIRQWFSTRKRTMEPNQERQALLPQQAIPLLNRIGTAPGFRLHYQECELFFLPGVPSEVREMFHHEVLPTLHQLFPTDTAVEQRSFKLFGLSESRIARMIPYPRLPQDVSVAFSLDYPLVVVKLKASGEQAVERLDHAETLLLGELGDHLMARGDESPAGNVGQLLTRAGLTLSLAESCTGGLLASLLTSRPGASAFLERAAVTYADSAKQDWLRVPREVLERYGAVSEPCARAMAEGLRRVTRTDLAVSITGVAGPDGGTADKPVGTVYIALNASGETQSKKYLFTGDRSRIQRMSAFMALEWLRRYALHRIESQSPEA